MSFKSDVLDAIKSVPQWKDIIAEEGEHAGMPQRKNFQRCFEINTAIARTLNKYPDIEALAVGAHYPVDNPSCSNYYVLARSRATGEILLIDGVINSEVSGMQEPFVGTIDKAKEFMASHTNINWLATWNLEHLVVHAPEVPLANRNATRIRWGELSKSFVFDKPMRQDIPLVDPSAFFSSGHTLSADEMNNYAIRMGGSTRYLLTKPTPVESITHTPSTASIPEEKTPRKGGWRGVLSTLSIFNLAHEQGR